MDYIVSFCGVILVSLYFSYYFIIAWFYPLKIFELQSRLLLKNKKWFPFLPSSFLDCLLFSKKKVMYLWFFRLTISLAILLAIFILIAFIFRNEIFH